jgi:hypothetical protein
VLRAFSFSPHRAKKLVDVFGANLVEPAHSNGRDRFR